MSTVYSTGTQWPLLQSKTEQKFKSGLFNVSAEFIRPVGDTELPTVIETSIGTVDVWPEPTVSSGTDGFERINATGYGVWNANISEVVIGIQLGEVYAAFDFFPFCSNPFDCGFGISVFDCGKHYPVPVGVKQTPKKCLFNTVFIKKIGDVVPALPDALKIYNLAGIEITTQEINFSEFVGGLNIVPPTGTIQYTTNLSQISRVTYGTIVETSVTYEILNPFVNFGSIYEIPVPVQCSGPDTTD